MNTYLTIMVTLLILTQIIRLIQNATQLKILKESKSKEDDVQDSWDKMRESMDALKVELYELNIQNAKRNRY